MSFDSPLPPYNASDPSATFLNSSCLDFLMIELVPMSYRILQQLEDGQATTATTAAVGKESVPPAVVNIGKGDAKADGKGDVDVNVDGDLRKLEDAEERDALFYKLDSIGYRVGQGLVERFARDRPRFTDTLDVIKFLCKDLWMLVFRKQIDNLKTNHRGVYVLTDNSFRPFSRMSTEAGGQAMTRAQPFLWFPCGIIRGALASMGINCTVQGESTELPGATFQIKSIGAKA